MFGVRSAAGLNLERFPPGLNRGIPWGLLMRESIGIDSNFGGTNGEAVFAGFAYAGS